jgi:hypothetical protein
MLRRKPLTGGVIAESRHTRKISVDAKEPSKARRARTSRPGGPHLSESVRGAAIGLGLQPSLPG